MKTYVAESEIDEWFEQHIGHMYMKKAPMPFIVVEILDESRVEKEYRIRYANDALL